MIATSAASLALNSRRVEQHTSPCSHAFFLLFILLFPLDQMPNSDFLSSVCQGGFQTRGGALVRCRV
jgi:hypothetical protein